MAPQRRWFDDDPAYRFVERDRVVTGLRPVCGAKPRYHAGARAELRIKKRPSADVKSRPRALTDD